MKIHTCEQGGVEWSLLRAQRVTASEMDALVTPLGKVKTGDAVETYVIQKVCENWIGGPLPSVQGVFDIEQGRMLEERARPAFTLHTGIEVKQVGFVEATDPRIGCSPDGLCNGSGLELKAPKLDTHVRYLLEGELPSQYVAQVQTCIYVCEVDHWHFFSYRNGFPDFHLVVKRDQKYQDAIKTALDGFYERFNKALARMVEINGGPPDPKRRGINPFQPPSRDVPLPPDENCDVPTP